jgi:hypothetical protein
MKTSLIALSATALFACGLMSGPAHASDPDDPARLALAIKHSGEPVDHVTFFPRKRSRSAFSNSWELLGEREILFWHGKEKAWLVELRPSTSCRTLDKQFRIATSGGFSDLKTNGYLHSPNGGICRIDQIRPVNVEAMRADEARGGELAKS